MTPDEFRHHGRAVIDWIADYQENVESFPVLSQMQPGQIRNLLPQKPPLQAEHFNNILKDVDSLLPGVTHWQSPNFFAYFPANTSGPSILGELISAGLGIQGMLWSTSPACTELETHVLDWLVDMLGLPTKFKSDASGGGVIQDSASSAIICALLAARERTTNYESNEKGCDRRLVVYASTQTHSSIEKAVKIVGLGRQNLRLIQVDKHYAMRPDDLALQIKQDLQDGLIPCFVCATVGTTSSNAIDPLSEIGHICRKENIWFHVDGAMSGTAALCPEYRYINTGLELADSYCFNPHKWMFTNFDCDCLFVANRAILIKTLKVIPEYLNNTATESGDVIDYKDWEIPLGRRFRSLKLWFVIRYYGIEGLQYHVRCHIKMAQEFARWIEQSNFFELISPAPLNLICFRHTGGNSYNQQLLERLNQSGNLFLTHTLLNDQYVLRFCVGQTHTEEHHVRQAWQQIQKTALELEKIF